MPLLLLPAVVGESLVGLRHLVDVFAALHSSAGAVGGIEDLVGETLGHRVLFALAGELDEPAHGQGLRATGAHLDRHLVRRTTDPAGPHLDGGPDVVDRLASGS